MDAGWSVISDAELERLRRIEAAALAAARAYKQYAPAAILGGLWRLCEEFPPESIAE